MIHVSSMHAVHVITFCLVSLPRPRATGAKLAYTPSRVGRCHAAPSSNARPRLLFAVGGLAAASSCTVEPSTDYSTTFPPRTTVYSTTFPISAPRAQPAARRSAVSCARKDLSEARTATAYICDARTRAHALATADPRKRLAQTPSLPLSLGPCLRSRVS